MANYFRKSTNEDKIKKQQKIYTFYPEFKQAISYNPYTNKNQINNNILKNNNLQNKSYKNISLQNDKSIYIQRNLNNTKINYNNENINYYNTNNMCSNFNNQKGIIKKDNFKYRNINIKNYNNFNINNDDIYDEYIIDYKAGLNMYNFRKRKMLNISNDISFQNWQKNKINNNPNKSYNKEGINNYDKNNIKEVTQYQSKINKNNTINYFYNLNNTKIEKPKRKSVNVPYKKRIINEYAFNDYKRNNKSSINNIKDSKNINKSLTIINNKSDRIIKVKKQSNHYHTINYENDKTNNSNSNENILIKKIIKAPKKTFYIIKPETINETLIRINKFIQHFSKYSMLHYYKIIKQFFSSLRDLKKTKNLRNSKNIRKNKIPAPPFCKLSTMSSSNNRTTSEKYSNKLERRTATPKMSNNIVVDRIRSTNESKSPNENNGQEMYRNISELTKKCQIISSRKNRQNNNSLKKIITDISFSNENKTINEFRFSSVERNREKMEKNINKERERKKRINQRKKFKENEKKEISNLIQKNNILKNKIRNLEKEKEKEKKTIEINWNIDDITIKPKDKKDKKPLFNLDNREKQTKYNYAGKNSPLINKAKLNEMYLQQINEIIKLNNKNNEMINVKNISTKDKSIHININYLNYIPPISNRRKKNIKNNQSMYQIYNNYNISYYGNMNKKENKEKKESDKMKYQNQLTSILEEENKIDFSENLSQYSFEK